MSEAPARGFDRREAFSHGGGDAMRLGLVRFVARRGAREPVETFG